MEWKTRRTTWERVALVYMASPRALICETYRHSEQKPARKFCRSKENKNGETHPVWTEKGKTGCVLFFGARRAVPGSRGSPAPPTPPTSPRESGAALVLWEIFRAKTGEKEREIPEKT